MVPAELVAVSVTEIVMSPSVLSVDKIEYIMVDESNETILDGSLKLVELSLASTIVTV